MSEPWALHHVALGARDVARVARFYTDGLQLAERARFDDDAGRLRAIWLDLGPSCVLMIERTEIAARPLDGPVVGPGPFLIAVRAPDEGARDAAIARLEQMGAPVEASTEHTRYLRDPEGNRVAISCYPL